jgi:HEAT repeat protein
VPLELPAPQPSLSAYLHTVLVFLEKVGEEELKRVPLIGGVVTALRELSKETEGQQTEAKIDRLLEIGQQTTADIQVVTALAAAMVHFQTQLLGFFQAQGLPSGLRAIESVAAETALIAYRNRVAFDYMYADYRGVKGAARADISTALLNDDVYVTARLIAERGPGDSRHREADLLRKLEDQDVDPESRIRLEVEYAEVTGRRFRIESKSSDESRPAPEVVGNHRHMVILGSPGVGKSALSRFLARACALGPDSVRQRLGWTEDPVPVVLPLAAFADARWKAPYLSLRAFLDQRMEQRGGEALRAAVGNLLAVGGTFILLDGIDEVPDSSARASIVRAVDRFRSDHASNRILVTSRPMGYVRVAGDIPHFILRNFSPEQVEIFVQNWQRAQERAQRERAPDLQRADEEARAMLEEIRRNAKVAELATNPLILVIVSLIRREGRTLPDKRVQLYQRAVETLMDTWNQFRSLSEQVVAGQALPVDRLIRVWGAVASWTRETRPTGVIHRAELRRELVRILKEMEFDEESPEATAESYLEAAARNAGILEERGADIFAFWHPTFEEYLAAVDLTTPTAKAVERLAPHADDPRWREVILLGVGYVGIVQSDGETATQIVRALLDTSCCANPLEPALHRRLRLAAACIADDVGVKRNLAQEVIVRLGEVVAGLPHEPLTKCFVETVRALPRMRPSPETITALEHLEKYPNWEVRMEAARLFSNLAASDAKARDLCRRLLADSDEDVRCHAALGLARAGEYAETILTALYRSVESAFPHNSSAVRDFFNSAPSPAWTSLRSCLSTDHRELRYRAAALLDKLGRADEQVVSALLSCLSGDERWLRSRAAELLVKLGRTDQQVVPALRSCLSADDPALRHGAAEVLAKLGHADEQVVSALRSCLSADDPWLRSSAAALLENLGRADEQVVSALRSCLSADESWLRSSAAELLGKLGRADEQVVSALRSCLSADERWVRSHAAELLGKLGYADEQVVFTIRSWLLADESALRQGAAEALGKLGCADEQVISALRSCLSADDPGLRSRVAEVLGKLGYADEQVVSALRSCLSVDEPWLRSDAAKVLEKLGRGDEQVVCALRSWLSADDPRVRSSAAEVLEKLGRADENSLATLVAAIDSKATDAISACRKLHRRIWPAEHEAKSLAALLFSRERQPDRQWLFSWVEARCNVIQQAGTLGTCRSDSR